MTYKKKKTKVLIDGARTIIFLQACSLPYILPTLIPFLVYINKLNAATEEDWHFHLVVTPYVSYALLEFVDDRQGFNLPIGFLLAGITPGAILFISLYEPIAKTYHCYGIILSLIATLIIWIVLPHRGLTRLI